MTFTGNNGLSEDERQELIELRQEVKRLSSLLSIPHPADVSPKVQQIIELMPAGILVIDKQGRISDANPAAAELLGEPLVGELWFYLIDRCFSPQRDDGHEVSLKNGRKVSLATRAMTGDLGQLVMISDQTETRNLQKKLSHHQRLSGIGQMMASLAHQIRTPLAAALLYTDHLMQEDLPLDKRRRFAGKVKDRLSHMERQIRDMLIFARGDLQLSDRVTTAELLARLEDLLDTPLSQTDADFDTVNQAPNLSLQCNLETLCGVLVGLVENALQANQEGCRLLLQIWSHQTQVFIALTDNGPGMSEELQKKALEPFFTTRSHGTGLGLAIAQVVVVAHGGRLALRSQLGVGTTVMLVLPISEQNEKVAADEQ